MAQTLKPDAEEFKMPSLNPEAVEFMPLESRMRAEAAEFIPTMGWSALQALQQKAKRQMPPASEEEWETRIAKREKEVATIKSLHSYRLYVEVFPPDRRTDEDPKTPDPLDRLVSKRMWKWNVEKWRLQLKVRCVYSREALLRYRAHLRRAEEPEEHIAAPNGAASSSKVSVDGEAKDAVDQAEPHRLFLPTTVGVPPGIAGISQLPPRRSPSQRGANRSAPTTQHQ